jgi:hypothetical protein
VQVPFWNWGMSNFIFKVNGWLNCIASSRDPVNDNSIKMLKYIKFDLAGFFRDWSNINRIATTIF